MQAYMGITANILALLDASSLDDHSMMSGREKIIQQGQPIAGALAAMVAFDGVARIEPAVPVVILPSSVGGGQYGRRQ
jgi:hypothetical protein